MRQFGLIGFPLSHSFSQKYFSEKFAREGITDCSYENFPIPDISGLPAILAGWPQLEGLNVTIPYKKQVIPFLHDRSRLPIEACNCIRIREGRLSGFNTDIVGFEQSVRKKLKPEHRRALILGRGGASEAVQYVLTQLGISFTQVRRVPERPGELAYGDIDRQVMAEHLLIINASPVGMYPHPDECPDLPYPLISRHHYLYDLIYNPAKTVFLQKGEERGAATENGADMLVIQAEESWRIWNEKTG